MKVLFVLIGSFLLAMGVSRIFAGDWHVILSGNIAMCIMMCFAASAHFAFSKGMEMMIPSFIPFRLPIVYLTGVLEILLGIGLLFPQFRNPASYALIIFYLLILPANISAALRHVDIQKATLDGNGPAYLWFRIPMQLFFIAWIWYFGINLG